MKKKAEDQLWEAGRNATPVAVAIDRLVRPASVAIVPIFNDLERRHGLSISLSCTGVIVEKEGDVVYEKGSYSAVMAKGPAQCAQQRRYAYEFLRWCCTHYPTDLLTKNKGWIYGH